MAACGVEASFPTRPRLRAFTASSAKFNASRKCPRYADVGPCTYALHFSPLVALQSRVDCIRQLLVYATECRFPPTPNCSEAENSELGCADWSRYFVVKSKAEARHLRELQLKSRYTCKTLAFVLQNKPAQIGILCQIADVLAHVSRIDLHRLARAVGRGE